ncbi:hypothetical protein CQW23_31795 [Capsicum baccatum]|uniref:Uncharacterized protein n=1 Tax=Capsicum baccatum TaxID=33114 RepID=A0A2G2V6G5_CAPBA|nr:hypothetical protein CQW23_31795 [Capsicum baccatum]
MLTQKSKEEELLLFKRNQSSWVRRKEEVHPRIEETGLIEPRLAKDDGKGCLWQKGVAKGKFIRREDQDSLGLSKDQKHTWIYRPSREYQSSSLETIELAAGEGELQLRKKKNMKNCLSKDESADPNMIYEDADDEVSFSDKDVSDTTLPTRRTFSIVIFLVSSVRKDKREMLSISQKQISPSMLPRSAYLGIERKDPGPEQVGLGYRAISAVGGDRGRARNHSDVPLTQPRNGPEGTAAWGMSASHRKAYFSLWVIRQAALSDQGPGHKGPGTIQVQRTPEVTAMSRNLTHGPK